MEKVVVTIEWQSNKVYAAIIEKRFPTCLIGYGKSPKEAVEDLRYTIKETQEELSIDLPEMEFEYQYTARTILHMADMFNLAKEVGISPKRKESYLQLEKKPSSATARQIEHVLHELGKQLQEIKIIA